MPTRPQSQQHFRMIAWINDRIKNNEEEEGHVLIHWLLHGEKTLGNYLFRQKCIEHVSARFFPVRRWLKRRGGRGTWRRRRRSKRRNDSAGRRAGSAVASWQQGNNISYYTLQEHVWGHPWSWEFSPTRCLLFAYAVPTRGSSFIFGFWPCKLRGLRLCRKGNGIVPLAFLFLSKTVAIF